MAKNKATTKSHVAQFEDILGQILEGDHDSATEKFHNVVLEMSRDIYASEALTEAGMAAGGDARNSYAADIKGGEDSRDHGDRVKEYEDEIESEEYYEDEHDEEDTEGEEDEEGSEDFGDFEDETDSGNEEEEIEDRVDDLESALSQLKAEFDRLAGEDEEDQEGDVDVDFDAEGETGSDDELDLDFDADLEEAFGFMDDVKDTGMNKEDGSYSGTGAKSEKAQINSKSPYTEIAKERDHGGRPVDFSGDQPEAKDVDDVGHRVDEPSDEAPSDNVDYDHKESQYKGKEKEREVMSHKQDDRDHSGNTTSPMRPLHKQKKGKK